MVLIMIKSPLVKESQYKKELEDSRSAILNVLEDYRQGAEDVNHSRSAILNVLEDLEASKAALEQEKAALLAIGDGAVITDANGKITFANKTFEDLLGWKSEEIVERDLAEVMLMEDEVGNAVLLDQQPIVLALATHKKVDITARLVQKDKKKFSAALTATPILLEGKTTGAILVFRDITKEKEVDRLKDEFVSIASHELRTPLTAIDGLVSMILDGEYGAINKELKQPLEDVNTSSERLIHLVNDLLNLSRIHAGRLKYTLTEFDLSKNTYPIVKTLGIIAEDNKLTLKTGSLENTMVQADADKFVQIVDNLIGNALKYTDKGGITISSRIAGEKAEVYISDTGIGIAKEDQQKLFGQFQQLDSGKGRPQGTGLGLHISREMIRKMGGDLWIEKSEIGKGSTFAFSLPIAKSQLAEKVRVGIEAETKSNPDQKSD